MNNVYPPINLLLWFLKQRGTASKITFLPRPLDKPDPVLLFFTRFKAYTSVSMKLFNGSHDDSLGANWKWSLQSLHNPLNFKINPLTLLNSSSKNWKLQYRSKSCQVWYFKSITLDMFGMHSTMFRQALHFSKPIQLCSGYTPLRSGCVWLFSGWAKIFSECAGPFSCYAWLCPGYDYFRTAPLEGFVPFNSFILTQSRWYSVRHNAGFP